MKILSWGLLLVAALCALGGAWLWDNGLRLFAVALWFVTVDTTFFAFVLNAKMKRRSDTGSPLPKQ